MQDIVKVLAPQGVLRVALNFGNPVLAKRQPESGEPYGVSVALALELARRAGVPHQFINYEAAGHVFKDAANDVWDVISGVFKHMPGRLIVDELMKIGRAHV